MTFDKATARKIRELMQKALEDADIEGMTISVGNCSFTEGEATYKVNVLLDGGKSKEQTALEQLATLMSLDTSKIATLEGMKVSLVGYNSKARKRPWIIQDLTTAQKYILDDDTAKRLFGNTEGVK
jgi:hypothetical protein